MRFDDFRYLWPPRPEKAIPPSMLRWYESRGSVAQVKMNGTCNVMAIAPDRRVVAMTRHNEPHRAWTPTTQSSAAFRDLPGGGWYVFVAELLHSKVPGIRDTNYVHDLLVVDGRYLVGVPFMERQAMIRELLPQRGAETVSHYEVDAHTWVARNHEAGFGDLFAGLTRPEHEGLVIKSAVAPLSICGRASANSPWQVKCRRPAANYAF